jgi:ADP-ribose pyrophosphatase YjhB (NUDIX family)
MIMVDAVIIVGNDMLLMRRNKYPFQGKWVFPGGHLETSDRTTRSAMSRELFEETRLTVAPESWKLLYVLDGLGRDPRYESSMSIVYLAQINDREVLKKIRLSSEASEIMLCPISGLKEAEFGFDHYEAVKKLKK